MNTKQTVFGLIFASLMLVGCGSDFDVPALESEKPAKSKKMPAGLTDLPGTPDDKQATPAEKKPVVTQQKAQVGMGKKGHGYGTGFVAVPVATYWRAQERIALNSVTQAMNLYKATNGDFPKTHEEFMTQIIKANRIPLPELPAGQKYAYDPKQHQLMIEKRQ